MVLHRDAQHLGGDDARQGLREIRDDVHATRRQDGLQQPVGDLADVGPQDLDAGRREGVRREAPDPGMGRCVQEQHLLDHHLRDRVQFGQTHPGELLG